VPASIVGAVAVPGLDEDHEPAHDVGRHSHALSVQGREAEAFDELKEPQASVINKALGAISEGTYCREEVGYGGNADIDYRRL
jgi:hypothetical protein